MTAEHAERRRPPARDGHSGPSRPGSADAARSDAGAAAGHGDSGHVVRSEVPVLNPANVLTMLRILLVPVFLVVLFLDDGHGAAARIGAAAVFALAALTDRIDGEVARRRGLITDFGKIADPIADKALIGAALVGLSVLGDLTWWVTGLIAARELGVTALRFIVIRHGVIPASRGGKLKTLVQVAAIFLYLLPLPESAGPYLAALIWFAVALTLGTGADYVVQAVRLRSKGRGARLRQSASEGAPAGGLSSERTAGEPGTHEDASADALRDGGRGHEDVPAS